LTRFLDELIPPDAPLTDGKIVLRLREPKDQPAISAASHDPETRRWLEDEPISLSTAHVFRDPLETWAQGERAPFVIADRATDRALGLISLRVIGKGTGSVGVSVFPEGRGRGVGPAVLKLIARWAIAERGFQRVEAEADVANTASLRMIEKAGFVREGILRDHCETHGVRHDCVMFALTAADLAGAPSSKPRLCVSRGPGRPR
jgi:RimJ/RimL family protein N-acetyltransferase